MTVQLLIVSGFFLALGAALNGNLDFTLLGTMMLIVGLFGLAMKQHV